MAIDKTPSEETFLNEVARLLARPLTDDEVRLAASLQNDKSPEIVARELQASIVADPKKIRPEHSDTANE